MEKAIMEKSKVVKTDQPAANMMGRLPQEIILRILSRLPITSLVQSKLVCRAWRSLIRDPLLVSQHFSQMADNDPSFILQSLRRAPYDQLYFTDFSDFSEGKVISMKPDNSSMLMSLEDSCNGLLCMRDSRGIYICNPFTRLSIELPKFINYPPELGHLEFGFNPTKKEYKVIQILYRPQLEKRDRPYVNESTLVQSEVHVLTIGSPVWRNLGMISYHFIRQTSKFMVKGRLHWLCRPKKNTWATLLISFDLETEQFQEVPKPNCCDLVKCFQHLMVLRGCLCVGSSHNNKELEVWVMKEYGMKESWVKEFNIGFYVPQTLQQKAFRRLSYPWVGFRNLFVQVVCILKSGQIILEYRSQTLVLYDPQHGTFKELTFPGIPDWFKIVVHIGSLNCIDTPINF
ncbi:F-box protein At3g07870-like [Durio zibethinus]|uniref:F-box protein At3g07870-like n=1 Tax=Durio zibethinus TaxID=66656 RepID=A0A6P6A5N7_DURZI|nr:F-box protein At3g07870-like [Durio zibethinus]